MQSHCLNHQGIIATKRCSSCSIPLCDQCTQVYAAGVFCSEKCHQASLQAQERAAQMAQSDKELKERQQWQMARNLVVSLVVVTVLYFGWDSFPSALTDKVEQFWQMFKALPGKLS